MKNWICGAITIVMILSIGAYVDAASGQGSPAPLISATPMVKMAKDAEVTIVGTGFKPGEEVTILYTDPNGVTADIGYALKPEPKADDKGNWSTTWSCGRYIGKKLITEGVTTITVTDSEYNVLAHDSIAFFKGDLPVSDTDALVTVTPMVKMTKDAEVTIAGTGFKPGEEITILYTDPNGVTADIGYALKPEPKADEKGKWITTWSCGRYIGKKLITEGVAPIIVTDDAYNMLAHASIYFYAP